MKEKRREGHDKLLNRLRDLSDRNDFKLRILRMRYELDIMKEGYKPTAGDIENILNPFYIPFKHKGRKSMNKQEFAENVFTALHSILSHLPVQNIFYASLVKNFLYYDDFLIKQTQDLYPQYRESSLCQIVDSEFELQECLHDAKDQSVYISEMRRRFAEYPITIRIHPEATGVDIHNFLNANAEYIRTLQEHYRAKYKTVNLKTKKRKVKQEIKERNDFIYRNKEMGSTQIHDFLCIKGFFVDVSTIRKIIENETKRREKKLGED